MADEEDDKQKQPMEVRTETPPNPQVIPNAGAAEAQLVQGNTPPAQTTYLWQDFLNWKGSKWVLIGLGGLLTAVLILKLEGGKSQMLPFRPTPVQALQAQTLVEQQLASADRVLAKAGVSSERIAQAHNQVEIADGMQITLASRPLDESIAEPKKVFVAGSPPPNQYAALDQVNANRYVATLSPDPTLSDLTENSAVIHGKETIERN